MCYGSSSGRTSKGWHDFLLVCGWLLKGVGRASANKSGCKKHDSPQPGRQRRRAQQWQRVDCSLLSERGMNETEWSGMSFALEVNGICVYVR
jgi:hypothetical protein